MPCSSCTQTTAFVTGFNPAGCVSPSSGCATDASCVIYNGPTLACSGIVANDPLDIALQKIDPLLCAASGDYSSYNTFCLAPITTQQQFVESISNFVCTLNSSFVTFTGTTFVNYQASVAASLLAITNPQINCAVSGVTSITGLRTILLDYCTTLTNLTAAVNPSTANWNSCFVVSPLPTTIVQAFNVLIAQICLLQSQVSSAAVLPIFNNTGTCLTGGGAADTLVTTIGLIRTRLCLTGTLDTTAITWGCINQPSGAQNLQDTIQNILNVLTPAAQALPTQWSNDFTVTDVDDANPCLGKHIALATPSTQDRFVAATASDVSPGTLEAKITAGTNITLDFITTPGQMIVNAAGSGGGSTVKADSGDSTAGFLLDKLEGSSNSAGIGITPVLDTANPNHLVQLVLSVDPVTLFTTLLDAASANPSLMSALCTLIASCPSPCAAPTNVTVTYSSGTTTTTTSTTTTTTTTA